VVPTVAGRGQEPELVEVATDLSGRFYLTYAKRGPPAAQFEVSLKGTLEA